MSKEGRRINPRDIGIEISNPENQEIKKSSQKNNSERKWMNTPKETAILKKLEQRKQDWQEIIETYCSTKTLKEVFEYAESNGVTLYTTVEEQLHDTVAEFSKIQNKTEVPEKTQYKELLPFLHAETKRRVFEVYKKFFVTSSKDKILTEKIENIDESIRGDVEKMFMNSLEKNTEQLNGELSQMIDAVLTETYMEGAIIAGMHRESDPAIGILPPKENSSAAQADKKVTKKGFFGRLFN